MDIVWFDNGLREGDRSTKEKLLVRASVRDNEEEIHGLSRMVEESEIEAVKIITGDQEINSEGKVMLCTLELHFMKDLILIERVVEVQEPGSYTTKSTSTQLGYLEAPHSGDDCCSLRPKKK